MAPTDPLPPRPRMTPQAGGALLVCAPAKLNLNLLVAPVRADGFHPLDSYVAKVTLYDEVLLTPRTDGRIALACEGPDCGPPEANLAYRAAALLAETAPNEPPGVDIHLTKRIPPGKGLGGGSSDAAAVLEGLASLWESDISAARLAELAADLGSDVPLFLGPPAMRMTGRGERLTEVQVYPFAAVLYLPDERCATGEVYRAFDAAPPAGVADGLAARQLPADLLLAAPSTWRDKLVNDLAAPALHVCPALVDQHRRLQAALALPVHVTGSGSAMFILLDDVKEAAHAVAGLAPAMQQRCCVVGDAGPA